MIKFLKKMSQCAFLALFAGVFTLTACSDDDIVRTDASLVNEIDGESGSTVSSVITTKNGQQVVPTKIGDLKFKYDTQGRCLYVEHEAESFYYLIRQNPFNIIDSEEIFEGYSAKLNGRGFLARETANYGYGDKSDVSYSYNSDGQLVKISEFYEGYEEGYSGTATFDATLIWENGNLTSVVWEDKLNYKEYGTSGWENSSGIINIVYDGLPNTYRQMPHCLIKVLGGSDYASVLAHVGVMGVGPAMLPSKIEKVTSDSYSDALGSYISEEWNMSYGFNNDGTISYETRRKKDSLYGPYTTYYSYSTVNEALYSGEHSELTGGLRK